MISLEKIAVKILRQLDKEESSVSRKSIIEKYGSKASGALSFLEKEHYIKQGSVFMPHQNANGRAFYMPNGEFEIDSIGRDYLQHKFWNDFDRWATRICAVVGAITGIASLVWQVIEHFF